MYRIIPAIQAMDGAVAFVSAKAAAAAERDNKYLGDYDIGVLYTVVAGLMNVIVMLDAFCLAAARAKEGSG
jgi:tetrahydromethanopterin S-methyltransferase subunit G